VEATANHPLRVLNERGRVVWRTVERFQEGDVLVSALFGAETAHGASDLSEDEAVLLGYLIAEGTLGEGARNAVVFTNAHDDDVYEEYVSLLESVLGISPDRVRTYAGKDHKVHDTAARQRLADSTDSTTPTRPARRSRTSSAPVVPRSSARSCRPSTKATAGSRTGQRSA
jgi:recombination protein RecA